MTKRKKDKTVLWILIVTILLGIIIYGGTHNWFSSISNTFYTSTSTLNQNEYYCCNSVNGYSCNLNACMTGSSKVYVGSFDTLNNCNAQCKTPQSQPLQQVQLSTDQPLTCAQKAAQLSALFYINPVNTAKECSDFAVLDCQDAGKVIDGYGVSGTCCYFTCIAAAPQAICTDSDGGQDDQQFIKGTVTTSNSIHVDECNWGTGGVTEYYCDNGIAKQTNIMCENYWHCDDGACKQQLCEDITTPSVEKCAAGYTTDGGTCAYWNINNNPQCISSF